MTRRPEKGDKPQQPGPFEQLDAVIRFGRTTIKVARRDPEHVEQGSRVEWIISTPTKPDGSEPRGWREELDANEAARVVQTLAVFLGISLPGFRS